MSGIPRLDGPNPGDAEEHSGTIDSMPSFAIGELDSEQGVVLKDWSAQDFANIYVRFRPHLISHARKFLREETQAEEVVQDAFLYLMTALPELDSELGVLRFLKWKTKMLCFDYLRSSASHPVEEISDQTMAPVSGTSLEPHAIIEQADEAAVVRLALSRLSLRQREALIATAYLEKSAAEASNEMGLSENAFRQLLYRARKSFKIALLTEADERGLSEAQILTRASKRGKKAATAISISTLAIFMLALVPAIEDPLETASYVAVGEVVDGRREVQNWPRLDYSVQVSPPSQTDENFNVSSSDQGEFQALSGLPSVETEDTGATATTQALIDEGPEQGVTPNILRVAQSAFELGSFATDARVDISGEVANVNILPGVSAFLGLNYGTESFIQFMSLEVETEDGRLVGVPTVFMESQELSGNRRLISYVASDFVFGDLTGNFDFQSASLHPVAKHSFALTLEVEPSSNLVEIRQVSLSISDRP